MGSPPASPTLTLANRAVRGKRVRTLLTIARATAELFVDGHGLAAGTQPVDVRVIWFGEDRATGVATTVYPPLPKDAFV